MSKLRILLLIGVFMTFALPGFVFYAVRVVLADLPEDLQSLRRPPTKATLVFAADGELIGEFFLQKRVTIPYDRIPEITRQAFISAEDGRFWDHPGFDTVGILRASISNFRGGGSKQGASTITQQLARNVMGHKLRIKRIGHGTGKKADSGLVRQRLELETVDRWKERSYYRKMKELVLSVLLEREFSKQEILEMYLNRVYLGHGAYGVQAAAELYFGKDAADLTLSESALLAGLVQRPAEYDPHRRLDLAKDRQIYVLGRMLRDGHISPNERDRASAAPITLVQGEAGKLKLNELAAPYFVLHVRGWAERELGQKSLFTDGLRIYTTLDSKMQQSAEAAMTDGLQALDRHLGFRGPLRHLDTAKLDAFRKDPPKPYLPGLGNISLSENAQLLEKVPYEGAVVELPRRGGVNVAIGPTILPVSTKMARKLRAWRSPAPERQPLQEGDVLPVTLVITEKDEEELQLAQVPEVEGALVVMDPHAGAVRALVGGQDIRKKQFNRATQAKRQIGSAFKPLIYATAMSKGVTHLDRVMDSKVTIRTASGLWSPSNYDGKYLGSITLRTALAKSLNTVAVRLVAQVGVGAVIDMARRLGIVSAIPEHVSIALGTPDITLLEIVGAYSAFVNGGKRVPPQDDQPDALPGRFVELVTKSDGEIVRDYRANIPKEQAIPESLAYLTVDLMKGVVERGTGRKAQALGRPAAGKTGTATEWRIAWFVGYTADLVAGVWVARDDNTPIGGRATGGTAALPIWLQFMKSAHPSTPVRDFPVPTDVTLVRANELTGQPAKGAQSRLVPFAQGTLPARFAPQIREERFDKTSDFSRFR